MELIFRNQIILLEAVFSEKCKNEDMLKMRGLQCYKLSDRKGRIITGSYSRWQVGQAYKTRLSNVHSNWSNRQIKFI